MILIDTSAWIAFFRGMEPAADHIDRCLASNTAAICGPILTELRRGLRPNERERVLSLLEGCMLLSQPSDLWHEAGELGVRIKGKGATLKTIDLLIATYALAHGIPLFTLDADFEHIVKAGMPLVLA